MSPNPSEERSSTKKRRNPDELNIISKKKVKRSIDVTAYWKKIQSLYKTDATKVFECQSKNDYLIILDPLGDRSRFIISKSSYYWLTESIRQMQQHIDYGSTLNAAIQGEIVEIERNLKALKLNLSKNGNEKTYFYRAEALVNFIRLCSTIFESPSEKFRRRLHALFNLCASSWLHMFDRILPSSIVWIEKSFVFDEDYGDFQNNDLLQSFRKDDQEKIRKTNHEYPNLRHLLYSILLIMEKFSEILLIDRVYLERFEMIYEIWMLIDNELNTREHRHLSISKKKRAVNPLEKPAWNFLMECQKYEHIFGTLTSHHH